MNNVKNWTKEDSIKLFTIHKNNNSKWKLISTHFDGFNQLFIKNKFYSLVRKAFRRICKYYQISKEEIDVSKIKPKTFSLLFLNEFLLKFQIKFEEKKINFEELIYKFCFLRYN